MASNGTAPVGVSKNIKQIGRMDLPGGGSVVVENGYAYVGHMDPPHGTSIIDVKDPKNPKVVSHIEIAGGLHSHKVRVSGDIMLINYERYQTKQELQAGLKVFDISNRTKPREISMYAVAPAQEAGLPFRWEDLTDLLLTHLHFDHAGGVFTDAVPEERTGFHAPVDPHLRECVVDREDRGDHQRRRIELS